MKKQSYYCMHFYKVLLFMVALLFSVLSANATTYYSRASGNWNSNNTWSLSSGGAAGTAYPVAGDVVYIERGYTITVNISGAACASIQLGSTVSVTSSGTLTFASGMSLSVSGAIQIGSNGNAGRTGTITFVNSSSLTAGSITLGGPAGTPAAGTITMSAGSTMTTGSLIIGAGSGTWTPSTGTVILNANNTLPATIFTSFYNLTISSGTTTLGVAIPTLNGTLTVSAGANLALSTYNLGATTAPISTVLECGAPTGSSITGSGTLTLGGDVTVNNKTTGTTGANITCPVALGATRTFSVADDGTAAVDLTISGVISGTAGVIKAGAGTMTLSGANSYTGLTTINAGILRLGAAGGAANTPLGTIAGGTTVTAGAVLDLNGFTLGTAEPLTLNGTGISNGGALINSGGASTYNGAITLGSASSIGTTGNITLGANGITGGQYLTKSGSAILSLGSGATTINNLTISAGTLTSTSGTLNIAGDFINNGTFTHNNGTVVFNGTNQQVAGTTYYNLTISNGGTKTIQALTTINRTLTLNTGILQLGNNNLYINYDVAAAITGGAFGSTNMIATDGTGYLVKNATSAQTLYPVGGGGYYSPATLVITAGGTTGTVSVRAVSTTSLGVNFIKKYWDVLTSVGGKTITATFVYDPSEGNVATGAFFKPGSGSWQTPSGTASYGASSFTVTGTTDISNSSTWWTAGVPEAYYSYKTGSWTDPTTWTSDPGGTTQVGSTIPGNNDIIEILPGRTVSLPNNIASTSLDVTIDEGGTLDLSTFQFTAGLKSLAGQGTLIISSNPAVFPTPIITNTFINTGGGTTEYRTSSNLPPQAVYNNLIINKTGVTVIQTITALTLNGNLQIKAGTFQINSNTLNQRVTLTVNGDVTVDAGAFMKVGTGVTNSTTNPLNIVGGTAPFINYYDQQSHRIVLNGNFTNNGTVRFTNLAYPLFNAFPPMAGATAGFATVYFQGASDNTLLCNGPTDFYNLVLDKGTDQTFKLKIYSSSSSYSNFRLFGANIAGGDGGGANPNLKKALWIRTGTLVLQGLLVVPSLSEGTNAIETPGASPTSEYVIPANGALVLDGVDVVVQTTADDYQEVNAAYTVAGGSGLVNGVSQGVGNALVLYGKLVVNNGFLSTKESAGIITTSVASAPGYLILNNGTVDAKQFYCQAGGAASFEQNGGTFLLRGRFQRTPSAYSNVSNLVNAPLNTIRANDGCLTAAGGTFSMNNAANVFAVNGGNMQIYDVCGAASTLAFQVNSTTANINVTGGTIQFTPTAGTGGSANVATHNISSTAPFGNMTINCASIATTLQLNTTLNVLGNLTLTSGSTLAANNLDVTIGGNFSIGNGTTYTPGTNTTIFNGTGTQTFTVDLASALALYKLTIDKLAGVAFNFAGAQKTINVANNFRLILGTINDNGNTINLANSVYNSGLITGTGKIVLNGTVLQAIDGGGIFNNLELINTNAAAAPVSLSSNITINGSLTLSNNKIFNIGTYNLLLNATASIINGGALRYIQTSGNSGDGGLTKVYSSASPTFVFPIGAPTLIPLKAVKYTPATIGFSSDPSTYGSVTVIPAGYEHPATTINGQSLTYFWRVKSNGFAGIASNSVTHTFKYDDLDIVGAEGSYAPSLYNRTTSAWNSGTAANPPINTGANTFTDWTTPGDSRNTLDADYTAGIATSFGAVRKFYSCINGAAFGTGLWSDPGTWSITSNTVYSNPSNLVPGLNDIVVIGAKDSVCLSNVFKQPVINTNQVSCASLQIEKGSALDISWNPGSVFSMVLSHPNGNGNFRLTTADADGSTFVFPSGDFSDFNANSGTTEFYSISNRSWAFYLPTTTTTYGTVILSPYITDNIVFPNTNVTILGNLITRGSTWESWLAMTWNGSYGTIVPKTVTVKGNMLLIGGTFIYFANGATAQTIEIDGDVIVYPGAGIDIYGTSTNNSMLIGGSLINNSTNTNTNPAPYSGFAGSNVYFYKDANNYCNVTFFGSNNASVTNTGTTPATGSIPNTTFNKVTVNKGNSQATTLTWDIAGTLSTPADTWLTMQNGTLRYMRTNPNSDFTISTTTSLTIPSTAGLYFNYSNSGSRNILIANSASNTNDLYLYGKLTVVNGNVYVGPINGTTNNNNDIEYASAGSPTIEVDGGNLVVNGQIRRNPSITTGSLSYIQNGGNVTINGNATNTTNAKLEVLNSGAFNMTGGTLNILQGGGGTTYGDLYLRPVTSNVTAGSIVFSNVVPNIAQTYLLDANVPLNNLTITGAAGFNATLKLMVNPLVLNGDLTLTNTRSIFDANSAFNINVSIKGNFNNSGTYTHYLNLTTFNAGASNNGGVQSLLGTSAHDFYDLQVSPVTKLIMSKDITISHNLNLSSGTLECATFKATLSGDFFNNANYTNTYLSGGEVILSGTQLQHISGTGTFGQLELNNTAGATIGNNITLQDNLIMTTGILDINTTLLSLGQSSNIMLNGAPYSSTKMIATDGVWSNVGILKNFASPYSGTFTFPMGTGGKYTPAVLTVTSNGHAGSIRVNNINRSHPAVVDINNVLKYYWEIESIGLTGFNGNFNLNYLSSDVIGGPESSYVAAELLTPGINWTKATTGPLTDNVNETNHSITFYYNNSSNLTGEYTAGNDPAIPNTIPQYTSNADGNWTDKTIWTPSGGTSTPCPDGGPNGFIVTINHVVTADANYCFSYKTYINNTLRAVSPRYGHNFGTVYGTNGTIYIESAVFPAGRYDAFVDCASNNTIEYGGTGTYNVNADLYSSVPNVTFSGTGSRTLPDKDLLICRQLLINGPALDNSMYNRKLTIQGNMILTSGSFISGTGSGATVSFAGSMAQTLGNFTGTNSLNNLEINNSLGMSLSGPVDVSNNLLLTNGLITTSNTNKLTITNHSTTCVFPDGGSAASYIDGPLVKSLNQGDPSFKFPIGKKAAGLGNKLSIRATQTGTLLWTAEYFNPDAYSSFLTPLTGVNSKEYWTISGVPAGSMAFVKLGWDPVSDLTPLMTQNGLSDMRVAQHNGTDWTEDNSGTTGGSDNYNGSVETTNRATFASGTGNNFTIGCVNSPKPRVRMTPAGPICGTAGIPVSLTSSLPIVAPFTVYYTENGSAKSIAPASFPATIPTIASGATYVLTGFTYNYPSGTLKTGVVDVTPVVVNPVPTTATVGAPISLCGGSSVANLTGNNPVVGSGLWTIVSGAGGNVASPTVFNSSFTGTNGSSYTLRWTISSGACTSSADLNISFPLLPIQPGSFTVSSSNVCQGQNGVVYTVPNDPTVTYTWSYSGTGSTIAGTTNSVTVSFSASATSGTLSVTATNGCGTSTARTMSIAVQVATFSYSGSPYCQNASNPSPTFGVGSVAGIFSSTSGLVFVSASTGQVDLASSTPGTYTVTNTLTSAPCGTLTATNTITISGQTWTGAVNNDWNTSGNWSCGFVPYPTTDVEIPVVTNSPVINSGSVGNVNNLIIDAGSSLTVTGNSIQIAGNITNNGTFDATNGTLVADGSASQSIGAGIFSSKKVKNLTINNPSGVTLLDTLKVTGIVLVSNGNLASNGYLVLLSTASGTALINGSGTGNVTGNVTMQRYLPSDYGYKYFSSPFQAATVNEFGDDMNLLSSSTLFYRYDESRISSGWVNYKVVTNVLNPLAGYAVNFGSSTLANTVDITGIVNNGPMSITLYNHNNTYTKGFNLMGNPYPSPIDWDASSGWTKSNIDNAIYYFKASSTDQYGGTYSSYVNGISSDGSATNIIPSMQGFFIHVSDGAWPVSGVFGMNNSVRITDLTHPFSKSLDTKGQIPLCRLIARYSNDASSIDPMVIYFDEKASADFDSQLDAIKLLNTDLDIPNLSTVCSNGTLLSINAMPPITGDLYTVPLGLKLNRTGTQTAVIKISDIDESLAGYKIYITDVIAGTQQDLLNDNEFSVTLAKGEYNTRFFLNFSNLTTDVPETVVKNDSFSIYSFLGKIRTTISTLQGTFGILTIYNLSGQELFNEKIYYTGSYEYDPGLKDGIYIANYTSGSFRSTKKLFIKNP